MLLNTSTDILSTMGSLFVIGLTLLGTVIVFFVFTSIVAKFKPSKDTPDTGAAADGTAADGSSASQAADPVSEARRLRMVGLLRTLDLVGSKGTTAAKRALTVGDTAPAKSLFERMADDYPAPCARGLAVIADLDGESDRAGSLYAEMHATNVEELGAGHPRTRQGAELYAMFLHATAPESDQLKGLQTSYGAQIGA